MTRADDSAADQEAGNRERHGAEDLRDAGDPHCGHGLGSERLDGIEPPHQAGIV